MAQTEGSGGHQGAGCAMRCVSTKKTGQQQVPVSSQSCSDAPERSREGAGGEREIRKKLWKWRVAIAGVSVLKKASRVAKC